MTTGKVIRHPIAHLTHQHLRRHALDLAELYKGLADELRMTARTLEKAERPFHDPYPVVSAASFGAAIGKAAVLHFVLDEIQRAKK